MFVELDPAERRQVGDQPRHAVGLGLHDAQELLAGRRIVLGVAAQGLDEAGQRGERGAQLVAGVGQEIDAGALHPANFCLVVKGEQRHLRAVRGGRERAGADPQAAGLRAGRLIDPLGVGPIEQCPIHGRQNLRIADGREQHPFLGRDPQQVARRGVGEHETPAGQVVTLEAGDHEDRVRQGVHQGRIEAGINR